MSAPSVPLTPAPVTRAWDETAWLRGITLAVPADVLAAHRGAGQYVKLSALGVEGHFALAAAPGKPFELLVKRGSALGDAMAGLTPGAEVGVSQPLGPGYPLEAHRGRDLHLFGAGSGIAPLRAVIDAVRADRAAWGRVTLWDGQRSVAHIAYQTERPAWHADGIEIEECLTAPDEGWTGARGRVQDVFASRPPALTGDAVAYVCGMKGLVEGVKAALGQRGLGPDRVFLNY